MALEFKSYEQYLPLYRNRRRWSDRVVSIEQPLFPGYVFCRFDPKQPIQILRTPGIISIIGFGRELAPIPDAEIEAIQTVIRSGAAAEPCPFVNEGRRIRVTRGALEGVEGILTKKKSDWRMIVSVTLLQRSISVEIDCDWITPI